ncbi:MAG: DegV family protein [Anaerolineales bacterium]|nr:DegV family protein [Anaerolineales bacterium]
MPKVQIITDSAATIDAEVARELDIMIVPLVVRVRGRDYRDGVDLTAEELLLNMASERLRPKVVGPTSEQFLELYTQQTRSTNQLISLHSSGSLSPVYREARRAAREFLGRCDIMVMDSETVSLGLGILVEAAARMAQENVPLAEIVRELRGMIRRVYIVMVTDTLDYLEHNRLISPAQAILGTMLDVKPFLSIEEGKIVPIEKVRSRERAIDKIAEFASEFSRIERMAILQSTPYATEETKMLRDRLELVAPGHDMPILLYGPVLASHIGPDGIGLVVYEGTRRGLGY